MTELARVQEQTLSDGSVVYNVVLANPNSEDYTIIGAYDAAHAENIRNAINEGASWVIV